MASARAQDLRQARLAKSVKITAIPIDFNRDNPERTTFGKLAWRGGLNLVANSPFFDGFSTLAINPLRQDVSQHFGR